MVADLSRREAPGERPPRLMLRLSWRVDTRFWRLVSRLMPTPPIMVALDPRLRLVGMSPVLAERVGSSSANLRRLMVALLDPSSDPPLAASSAAFFSAFAAARRCATDILGGVAPSDDEDDDEDEGEVGEEDESIVVGLSRIDPEAPNLRAAGLSSFLGVEASDDDEGEEEGEDGAASSSFLGAEEARVFLTGDSGPSVFGSAAALAARRLAGDEGEGEGESVVLASGASEAGFLKRLKGEEPPSEAPSLMG